MAALTESAVEALLGLLSTAITDEAKLLGGVPGDLQFIKDEMDSMNGFLKYLNKMEGHDDQVRAWMKQVREVSYIAEDCVDRYVRDIAPYLHGTGPGCLHINMIIFFLHHPTKYCKLRTLASQLAELKLRVSEVGERRVRYDVKVPVPVPIPADQQDGKLTKTMTRLKEEEEQRETFRQELEKKLKTLEDPGKPLEDPGDLFAAAAELSQAAVDKLPPHHVLLRAGSKLDATTTVRGILEKCCLKSKSQSQSPAEGAAAAAAATAAAANNKENKAAVPTPTPTQAELAAPDAAADKEKKEALRVIKMLLCAIYVYPYATNQELTKLLEKLENGGGTKEANREQVMIFCYSMLPTQEKSCLQYLTAFLHESEISRTSMVRRWAAEGLLGKLEQAAAASGMRVSGSAVAAPALHPQEAGERCFRELVFRGFVCPRRFGDAGTVKSCVMEEPIKGFIRSITTSENFLLELPAHLSRQLRIREIVQEGRRSSLSSQLPPAPPLTCSRRWRNAAARLCSCSSMPPAPPLTCSRRWRNAAARLCSCSSMPPPEDDAGIRTKDPMDELVDFLKGLPEMYRLNVLDLGGCKGLRGRHLKRFGKHVDCLKYLSLRNTDVSRLEARHINRLKLLETLDIRGTKIHPGDTKKIYLPNLKHLLGDRSLTLAGGGTMWMPDMIGQMKNMETLCHVQVSEDGVELEGVVRLRSRQQLRKLGVVVHGNPNTAAYLGRVLYALAGCLRSLSIWVATQTQTLDIPSMPPESTSRVLENLDIKGKMTGFPSWIGGRDQKLANVTLRDTEINGGEALRRLGCVPNLRCLRLVGQAFTEQALVFKDDVCFEALRVLVIQGNDAITSMAFDDANKAALKLEKIVWAIGSPGGDDGSNRMMMKKTGSNDSGHLISVTGINNLPSLKEIELRGDFNLPNVLAESKKKAAADFNLPNVLAESKKAYFNLPNVFAESKKKAAADRTYCCRYVSSDGNTLIHEVKVKVVASHRDSTCLSLPVRVINQQQ